MTKGLELREALSTERHQLSELERKLLEKIRRGERMSQNRQESKDRIRAEHDYEVN